MIAGFPELWGKHQEQRQGAKKKSCVPKAGEAVTLEEGGSGRRRLEGLQLSARSGRDTPGRRRPSAHNDSLTLPASPRRLHAGCVREARARRPGSGRSL